MKRATLLRAADPLAFVDADPAFATIDEARRRDTALARETRPAPSATRKPRSFSRLTDHGRLWAIWALLNWSRLTVWTSAFTRPTPTPTTTGNIA